MFSQEITPCWCIAEKFASRLKELLKYIIREWDQASSCARICHNWNDCWWSTVSDKEEWTLRHKNFTLGLQTFNKNVYPFLSCTQICCFSNLIYKMSHVVFQFGLSVFLCQTELRAETNIVPNKDVLSPCIARHFHIHWSIAEPHHTSFPPRLCLVYCCFCCWINITAAWDNTAQCQDYVLKCNFTEPARCTNQAQLLSWTIACVCGTKALI